MGACAFHKIFFTTSIMIWMTVTMYMLKTGSGNSKSEIYTKEAIDSLNMMKELEKQNTQLREIAQKMRIMETHNNQETIEIQGQRDSIVKQLEECRTRSKTLVSKMMDLEKKAENFTPSSRSKEISIDPGLRMSYNQIVELWYFVNSRLDGLYKSLSTPDNIKNELTFILDDVRTRKSVALVEIQMMQEAMRERREREMNSMQELVQKRLHYLQNPQDCDSAKKLVCNLNKGCGFGCQLHHVAYCFMIAVGTERTFILESGGWRYSPEGWESVFLPLSKTCRTAPDKRMRWTGEESTKNVQVVFLPIVDSIPNRPPYMPLNIPQDLAPKLEEFHGNPAVWWLGQLVSYLMRPQPWLANVTSTFKAKIGFESPVVGIHIRRTDKVGSEAAFHGVREYMVHAIDWFDKEDLRRQRAGKPKVENRLVYVASDEPRVFHELSALYPSYKFLGDVEISKVAAVATRYSKTSLIGVLTDIFLLSQCDFIVGTFSSQVSRVAYELMQTLHSDASTYAHSLDDIFYFGGQGPHSQKVMYSHIPRPGTDEIEMATGDYVGVAGNHWDGFSKGRNRRTNKVGLYPSYKVTEVVTTAKYPLYPDADNMIFNKTEYT